MDLEKKLRLNLKKAIIEQQDKQQNPNLKQIKKLEEINKFIRKKNLTFNDNLIIFHQSEISRIENLKKITFYKYLVYLSFLSEVYNIDLNKLLKI